jgi:cyanophycin synthetase
VVVKPTWDSACGYCVVCNIQNKAALIKHFDRYIHSQKCISIETFHPGLRSFRVLVFYGQVIGVVERFPAKVVGDGQHSIRELIKEQNMIRKKLKKTIPTGPITINEESGMILSQLGLTLESIPDKEQIIPLRYICNSTYGGTFKSLPTTIICKENAALAIEAARVLDLNLVGFDIICDDIAIPIKSSHGYIIEANADPDITIHEGSFGGKDVMVSETIVKKLIKSHPLDYLRHYFRIHGFIGITLRLGFFMLIFFGLLYGSQFYAG